MIDVHAHLFDANMPVSADEAIRAARKVGVEQFVVPGLDVATSQQAIDLAMQHPNVCFATIGVHPHEVLQKDFVLGDAMAELDRMVTSTSGQGSGVRGKGSPHLSRLTSAKADASRLTPHLVGIGEVGIDYHHHTREETGKIQREAFAAQLALGVEHDLPIIVHGRKAYDDVLDVIRAHPGSRGLLHSFEASYEVAKQALDLGWLISFTALVTYPGNEYLLDVATKLPLDWITVETDAPYLPPQSVRERIKSEIRTSKFETNSNPESQNSKLIVGRRGINNQPAYMVETAEKLAAARGISLEELAEATTHNARTLFRLPAIS